MYFTQDYKIGLDDVDINGNLKDKSILRFLENSACFHADTLGDGLTHINENKKAWALLEWQVKILKRPHYGNKVTVKTWGRKYSKVFVYRDYVIYENDEPAVYASSKWFVLDLVRRMPARILAESMNAYGIENESILGIDEIEKLEELESYDNCSDYTVRKSDVDMLGHFHNTNYLEMIYETLDDNEISQIKNIKISYKKEIPYGETVSVCSKKEEGKIYVAFKTNDKSVTNALAELS